MYYKIADSGLLIHHLLCIFAFGTAAQSGYGGLDSMVGLLCAEISNFPMHIRCILKNYNRRYTKSYEVCENAYLGILYSYYSFIYCSKGSFLSFLLLLANCERLPDTIDH